MQTLLDPIIGLRIDGRKPNELRKIQCEVGVFAQADGSASLSQGNTKIIATVYGPHENRAGRSKSLHDKAVINCQYSVATFSGTEHKNKPHGDWKSIEMTMHLKQTFEAVIQTEKFPKSQIDIYVEVLQSDGGNYCACVNAATLAIMDAGIPIKDYVCACSVSLVRDTPLIDINHLEESSGNPHFTLALLPNYDQIVLMESASRMHVDHLDKMIDSAMIGCKDIYAILNKYMKSRVNTISKNFSNLI